MPDTADVSDESIKELVEEGQSFEAEVLMGVEEADDSVSEVHTKQLPEDDVPLEYQDAAEPPRSNKD